jgi:hypothetical protein
LPSQCCKASLFFFLANFYVLCGGGGAATVSYAPVVPWAKTGPGCTGIYKLGNKYLPSAYKTQFEFRSHFRRGGERLIGREMWYIGGSKSIQSHKLPRPLTH